MNLAIIGYGKMGRLIEQLAPEYGFAVTARLNSANNADFQGLTRESLAGTDVAVEFSAPASAARNIERLAGLSVNVVAGTTGWHDQIESVRSAVERAGTALVWGPNFSVGVHLFFQIVSQAAALLAREPDYGAWSWEIHHSAKKDAPSGTLHALVAEMKRAGYDRPISASASRAGAHPGTHEVGFDSPADTITLRHAARSREGFARGALRAARWIAGKKGVFAFRDIVSQL
jgi:4-hydroxy-tetrahydrodipicolinate reductase